MSEKRPCRCLLKDSFPEMAVTVAEYVRSLPGEARADEETYRRRLDVCSNCQRLRNGTCSLCGCYVEARAAKKTQRCPDLPPRWKE